MGLGSSHVHEWFRKASNLAVKNLWSVLRIGLLMWAIAVIQQGVWMLVQNPKLYADLNSLSVTAFLTGGGWQGALLRIFVVEALLAFFIAATYVGIVACLCEATRTGELTLARIYYGFRMPRQVLSIAAVLMLTDLIHVLPTAHMEDAPRSMPVWAALALMVVCIPVVAWLYLAICDLVARGTKDNSPLASAWSLLVRNVWNVFYLSVASVVLVTLSAAVLAAGLVILQYARGLGLAALLVMAVGAVPILITQTMVLAAWLYGYRSMALKAGLLRVERPAPAETTAAGG